MKLSNMRIVQWVGIAICFVMVGTMLAQSTKKSNDSSSDEQWSQDDQRPPDDRNSGDDGNSPGGPGGQGGQQGGGGMPPGPPPGGMGGMEDLSLIKKENPELYKLIRTENDFNRRIRSAVMKYRKAAKDQRTTLKKEVRDLLDQQFDVSQQRREVELKWREKAKEKILDKKLTDILTQESNDRRGQRGGGPGGPPPGGNGNMQPPSRDDF
jgi:hypothetical protein